MILKSIILCLFFFDDCAGRTVQFARRAFALKRSWLNLTCSLNFDSTSDNSSGKESESNFFSRKMAGICGV